MGPYRGVARPGACFAIERLVDEVARELKREPFDLRRQNIVTAAELPYETAAGMRLDTGDYIASLDTARDMIDLPAVRKRQADGEPDGRAIGVGFAFYTEQSGHGMAEFVKRKFRVMPGYKSANARMLPDGSVMLHVGVHNHGQGHETTLAQIAAHELAIDPARISLRYGDTAHGPYGFGTFASRSIVFAGGAVGQGLPGAGEKIRRIGAHLLQTDFANTRIEAGAVHGPSGKVGFAEIAYVANVRQEQLPAGMDPLLEAIATYEPTESGGVFAYGTHAVVVAVDPDSGVIEILDYVGRGGLRHHDQSDDRRRPGAGRHRPGHRHRALRGNPLRREGQPLATTFARLHGALRAGDSRMCALAHMVTPALATEYGVKGLGEGGAIAPPAAIANAVADAFRKIGASFNETPLTPRRVSEAVDRARTYATWARQRMKRRRSTISGRKRWPKRARARAAASPPRRSPAGSRWCRCCNLRVALPELLVDISRLDELKIVSRTPDSLRIGALTTHAAIEDGKVPDIFSGLMRRVAGQISYRAVRNHGTIGGSVALADPAADWPGCLLALGASLRVVGPEGRAVQSGRRFRARRLRNHLAPGEIILGFDIPRPRGPLRWGFAKVARKSGAFAQSIAFAVARATTVRSGSCSPPPARARACLPRPLSNAAPPDGSEEALRAAIAADLAAGAGPDAYQKRMHTANILRAVREMRAQ